MIDLQHESLRTVTSRFWSAESRLSRINITDGHPSFTAANMAALKAQVGDDQGAEQDFVQDGRVRGEQLRLHAGHFVAGSPFG